MRSILNLVVVLLLTLTSTNIFAQARPATGVGPGLGVPGGIWGSIESGNYGFFHYQGSQLEEKKLDQAFGRTNQDRDFYVNYLKRMNDAMERFVGQNVMGVTPPADKGRPDKSDQLLDESFTGLYSKYSAISKPIPPIEFLNVVRRYNAARSALLNDIKSIATIPTAARDSKLSLAGVIDTAGQQVQAIPQWGNIDFKEITDFYLGRLQTTDEFVMSTKLVVGPFQGLTGAMLVSLPNPTHFSMKEPVGLVFDPGVIQIDETEVTNLQNKVLAARKKSMRESDVTNAFTAFAKNNIQRFIEVYGTSERWRPQDGVTPFGAQLLRSNGNVKGFTDSVKDITEIFWTRSFIRAEYGIPLGVIGVQFKKMIFGLDQLISKTELKWYADPITKQADLMEIEQSIRNALNMMDQRAQALTKKGKLKQAEWDLGGNVRVESQNLSEKILEGDVSWAGKASSFATWALGNRPLANANLQILRMLAADLYEEKLLMKGDLRSMNVSYAKRYFSTEEDKKFFAELETRFDPSGDKVANDDIFNDSATIATGTLAGEIKPMLQVATVRQAKLMEARQAEAQLEMLLRVKDSVEQKKQQDRRNFRRRLTDSVAPGAAQPNNPAQPQQPIEKPQ